MPPSGRKIVVTMSYRHFSSEVQLTEESGYIYPAKWFIDPQTMLSIVVLLLKGGIVGVPGFK